MKVANAVQQLKSELMSCYQALKTVLRLSRATGFVYMVNVKNWDRRCAHCSSKGPRVGLQSYGWLGAVGEALEGIGLPHQVGAFVASVR